MWTRLQLYNPNTIKRLIKEGRGAGFGRDYQPWLTVRDVSSRGRSSRPLGHTTGRVHHLLSKHLETAYFHIEDWDTETVDIREQFPLLPLQETLTIAAYLGVAHPADSRADRPIVMTTDFLITKGHAERAYNYARSLKPAEELDERVAEKYEIERLYWKAREIECLLVTDRDIPSVLAENLRNLHHYRNYPTYSQLDPAQIDAVAQELTRMMQGEAPHLVAAASACDLHFHLEAGTGLAIANYLVASTQWNVDLTVPYLPRAVRAVGSVHLLPASMFNTKRQSIGRAS